MRLVRYGSLGNEKPGILDSNQETISTETPPGVGFGQRPPVYLWKGNRVRCGIAGLGEQDQEVLAD